MWKWVKLIIIHSYRCVVLKSYNNDIWDTVYETVQRKNNQWIHILIHSPEKGALSCCKGSSLHQMLARGLETLYFDTSWQSDLQHLYSQCVGTYSVLFQHDSDRDLTALVKCSCGKSLLLALLVCPQFHSQVFLEGVGYHYLAFGELCVLSKNRNIHVHQPYSTNHLSSLPDQTTDYTKDQLDQLQKSANS